MIEKNEDNLAGSFQSSRLPGVYEEESRPRPVPTSCFLKPTVGRIIVQPDTFKYEGRIIIPERTKEQPTTGHVIATAPELEEWLGKRVLYSGMSGVPLKFKRHSMWICFQVEEILAEVTLEDAELAMHGRYEDLGRD